jgi:hypothetical protein
MTTETDPISVFLDCVAGAIVTAKASGRWRLNVSHIAAVGQSLGIPGVELDEGGRHFAGIMERVGSKPHRADKARRPAHSQEPIRTAR